MTFETRLQQGQAGESAIARWLRSRGHAVLPAYEKIIDNGKGPRLFTRTGPLVAPDLLVFQGTGVIWIEAKHKTAFTWHRATERWVTGIDLHHYEQYQLVSQQLRYPIWLLFLHDGGQAKDSPPDSPSGLFGNNLAYLTTHENHRHMNGGRAGMVYWAVSALVLLASREALRDGPGRPVLSGNSCRVKDFHK